MSMERVELAVFLKQMSVNDGDSGRETYDDLFKLCIFSYPAFEVTTEEGVAMLDISDGYRHR